MPFAPAIEAEIAALARQHGAPQRSRAVVAPRLFDPLTRQDRYGEVCMVIRRPSGRLIVAIKDFYPAGCYRLPTGGVGHGEPIAAGLWRELAEETGLKVAIARFLAVVEYATDATLPPLFGTFAFLLDADDSPIVTSDPDERIADWREVTVAELTDLASALEAAPDVDDAAIGGNWRDWGMFRGAAHRAVLAALS